MEYSFIASVEYVHGCKVEDLLWHGGKYFNGRETLFVPFAATGPFLVARLLGQPVGYFD